MADLVSATAAGQAMFKASCSEVVLLEGLTVTRQFSKDAENEVEPEGIKGLREQKCFKCQKTGHIAKDCQQKRKKALRKRTGTAIIVAKLATGPENALRSKNTKPIEV